MCERFLKVERQTMERMSAQKVIHAEAFNKVCEALKKVCSVYRNDWDLQYYGVIRRHVRN